MSQYRLHTEAFVVMGPKSDFLMRPIVLDEVRPNEVLVEMMYTGICHTDLVMQQGLLPWCEFPAIFGHEGAGIIKALGENVNKSLQIGDHIILCPAQCEKCRSCVQGRGDSCSSQPNVNFTAVRISDGSSPARLADGTHVRSQFFGQSSFSRMSVVHEHCLVKCSSPESLAYYAPLGCGFQTGAGVILNKLKPTTTSRIVIFGMGSVGIAALMAAAYLTVECIVAIDIVDQKLVLAKELGASHTLNSATYEDITAAIKDITGGGPDIAIDCTGVPDVIQVSVDCLGHGGTAVSIGIPPPGSEIKMRALDSVFGNKSYVGVTGGGCPAKEFIPKLMGLHQQGHFPIDRICHIYPVKDFDLAISDLRSGKVMKPIIRWSD